MTVILAPILVPFFLFLINFKGVTEVKVTELDSIIQFQSAVKRISSQTAALVFAFLQNLSRGVMLSIVIT